MTTIDPALLAQVSRLAEDQLVPIVLRFDTGDGVRAATRRLLDLGFVAFAATPREVAGEIPAREVERLATVPGIVAVLPSQRRQPR